MNKIKLTVAGLLIACLGIGAMNAQDKPATTTAPAKTTKKAPAKTGTPPAKATPAKTPATGTHMKKDGTPDKRYKENKTAKPADGTAPAKKSTGKKSTTKKAAPKKAATAAPAATKTM